MQFIINLLMYKLHITQDMATLLFNLFDRMLSWNPHDRISASQAIMHPIFEMILPEKYSISIDRMCFSYTNWQLHIQSYYYTVKTNDILREWRSQIINTVYNRLNYDRLNHNTEYNETFKAHKVFKSRSNIFVFDQMFSYYLSSNMCGTTYERCLEKAEMMCEYIRAMSLGINDNEEYSTDKMVEFVEELNQFWSFLYYPHIMTYAYTQNNPLSQNNIVKRWFLNWIYLDIWMEYDWDDLFNYAQFKLEINNHINSITIDQSDDEDDDYLWSVPI